MKICDVVRPTRIVAENAKVIFEQFDTLLTDCDGVIWILDHVIPGAVDFVKLVIERGKRIFFVTNNSTKSRDAYVNKCRRLGFPAVESQIYCTGASVAKYLESQKFDKSVYIIGTAGIGNELDKVGITHHGIGPDQFTDDFLSKWDLNLDPNVGAVVVGFDGYISYPKILKAASYLKNPNVQFIGTNIDAFFPRPGATTIQPGTGTMVTAVATASGRQPVVLGKPEPLMFELLQKEHSGVDPKRTLMIGDNTQTDIVFGKNCGLKTLCVMTGVASEDELEKLVKKAEDGDEEAALKIPDYWVSGMDELAKLLKEAA